MKAREYNRRVFRKELKPNILCYKDLKLTAEEIKETFTQLKVELTDELLFDLKNIQQATNLGSLISPHSDTTYIQEVIDKVVSSKSSSDVFLRYRLEELEVSLEHLLLLSNKYHCVVDNPPYMGGGKMNKELSSWVKTNYPRSKSDLMACFMEVGLSTLLPNGILGMINQHSWMFLSSYESLREELIKKTQIDTLLHLGPRTFPEIGGEVVQNASFTLINQTPKKEGRYLRLVDINSSTLKRDKTIEAIQDSKCGWYYTTNQKDFSKIPGSPIGYWLNENVIEVYEKNKNLNEILKFNRGISTSNNDRFLRYWHEISEHPKNYNKNKWYKYNKGGSYRKWYGNKDYVINWENNASELKESGKAYLRNLSTQFIPSLSYSSLTSGYPSFRYFEDFLNDQAGNFLTLKGKGSVLNTLAFLNSKVARYFLEIKSQTLNITADEINSIPIPNSEDVFSSDELITICKLEWDAKENSWDFNSNPLIKKNIIDLVESYDLFKQYWSNKFNQLHKNEEELNRQFIEIFGLQDELTPEVPLEDITILKEETSIVNGELVFDQNEVFSQFISYAVGCMFGRYSLNKEGLILANQGETLQDYLLKVEKQESELSFVPDDDNIIPILDDEWFEDDIVGRFYEFLKASFGGQNFEKNLSFVEESIGKDIRKYFVKDFYKDHIKRYKKRPIYWMFSSPKGSFNVLVYMHRYTPDTLNQVLNGYLNEYREKLKTRNETLDHLMISGSPSEQNKASKEKDKIQLVLLELQEYERETLYPLATERISIDLDDGVLVNYNKFGDAIAAVAGLNDKKAKEKVKKFDWIDTTTIR
jgi:hypothetical protein